MRRLASPVSFRQALIAVAALLIATLLAMAALVAGALAEADRLLDRLSSSQDQLARVTAIEARINALALQAYEGAPIEDLRASADRLGAQVGEYLFTVRAEFGVVDDGASPPSSAGAAGALEYGRATDLSRLVASIRLRLMGDDSAVLLAAIDERRRLGTLAEAIVQGERDEVDEALAAMRALEQRTTRDGVLIFAVAVLLLAGGGVAAVRNVGRPLRKLEEAADRVGRADEPEAPLPQQGFAEIRSVARAFNRLDAEVAAQRRALGRHAETLEAEVAARTEDLARSNAQLAEVDRTRRLFFSRVSHELRTPATVIRGEAEVALRRADAPAADLREALEHVAANSAFLQRRLEDLLAIARAEDGRITLKREPVRLDRLVEEVAALAEPYTRSSGMILAVDMQAPSGLLVQGDESWLKQALLAVIDNAAKFAAGAPTLTVAMRLDGAETVLSVVDGGPGVDQAALPFLFDAFYQAPEVAGRAGGSGGVGLGLSVTRWVAEQHGGSVAARNLEGRGLSIEMRLPATT